MAADWISRVVDKEDKQAPDLEDDGQLVFSARQHICYSALPIYAIARPSVCLSVRHTGGSVKDG